MGGHGYRHPRRRKGRRGARQGCQAMKPTLKAGLRHSFSYTVPASKTVPHLYEESPELAVMPEGFATGFMVGLMEWTCMQLLGPHLDPGEGSIGMHIDVSHKAATPAGVPVAVGAVLTPALRPRAEVTRKAHDAGHEGGHGAPERFIVNWDRFNKSIAAKAAKVAKVDA